jgi:hypothetical protein
MSITRAVVVEKEDLGEQGSGATHRPGSGFPKPDPVRFARFKKTDRKTGQTGRYTGRLGLPWFLRSG